MRRKPIMDFVPISSSRSVQGFLMSNHNVVGKSNRSVIDSLLAADRDNK
jgi:hypothetical protein